MNYTQIQQFLVFSKTLNMTKAAKELYISQPALSHSISRMEDELGLKLIYRDGNRLIMTEAGQELLKDFEAIEKVYDSMYAHAQMMREERTKKIVLGFAGSVTAFSALFNYGLLSSYKGLQIQKIFAEYRVINTMLLNGDVDFAITFPPLSGADIESRILIQDPIYLVIAGGHPLLRQATIYLRDLEQYELISLTADNPFASYCDELLSKKNVALSFRRVGYSKLMAIVDRERNQGKLLGLSSRKQFASWFGAGYRCLRIEDFNESLMTAVSWRKESSFAYEYKGLIKELEEDYDRIYYRNYSIMDPE